MIESVMAKHASKRKSSGKRSRSRKPARTWRKSLAAKIRPWHHGSRRVLARRLAEIVFLLQLAVLLTWLITDRPWGDASASRAGLMDMLWYWIRQPSFYPFLALVVLGVPMTAMSWLIWRGRHRAVLVVSWGFFFLIAATFFSDYFMATVRLLIHYFES